MPVYVIRWAMVLLFVAANLASLLLPASTAKPVSLALLILSISAPMATRFNPFETRLGILGFACACAIAALTFATQLQAALSGVAFALAPWPLFGPALVMAAILPFAPLAWRYLDWVKPDRLRRQRPHLIGRLVLAVGIIALYAGFAKPDPAGLVLVALPVCCALTVTLATPVNITLFSTIPMYWATTVFGVLTILTALVAPLWAVTLGTTIGFAIGLCIRKLRGQAVWPKPLPPSLRP